MILMKMKLYLSIKKLRLCSEVLHLLIDELEDN